MASPQSVAVTIVLGALVAGLMWWSAKRNGRFLLQRDFAARAEPPGPLIRGDVRFPLDEAPCVCLLGATAAGLYMASPEDMIKNRRWISARYYLNYLKTPVLIPWARLKYAPAKFPLTGHYRFDVTDTPIIFFMRKDVAEALLAQSPR